MISKSGVKHGLTIVFILAFFSASWTILIPAATADQQPGPGPLFGTITTLSVLTPQSDQGCPDIGENASLWLDAGGDASTFVVYNIEEGTEYRMVPPINPAFGISPAIDGNYVAWTAEDETCLGVHLFNLSSVEDRLIAGDADSPASNPAISGDILVWQQYSDGNTDIFMYHIRSGQTTLITPAAEGAEETNPAVDGDTIVWQGMNPDFYTTDIYVLDVDSGSTILLTSGTDSTNEEFPAISGRRVVYLGTDPVNFTYDIYLQDLDSGSAIMVPQEAGYFVEERASIDGDRVVWTALNPQDNSRGLFLYNISSGERTLIPGDGTYHNPVRPSIYGNRIVWQDTDGDTGHTDIRMMTLGLSEVPMSAEFSADNRTGGVPLHVSFTDLSPGEPSGWLWDFGDGTTSGEQNPVHTYSTPGSFDVSLIIHSPLQRSGKAMQGYIFSGSPPDPAFSFDPDEGPAPLRVVFTDNTTGSPSYYLWDFGDGTSSPERNPEHTYASPGSYLVSLTAGNGFGNSTKTSDTRITALSGARSEVWLDIPGISCESTPGNRQVTINSSLIQVNETGNSTIEAFPDPGSGIARIIVAFADGYSWSDPGCIRGVPSEVTIESLPLPWGGGGSNGFLVYQAVLNEYPAGGRIHSAAWGNATPPDFVDFQDTSILGNYSGICGAAFTAEFECENITGSPRGVLLFGIDPDWIQEYGWRRPQYIESNRNETRVYVDGEFLGYAPLYLPSNLSAGNHTITGAKAQYPDDARTITLEDKRDSIRVVRLAEDGTAEVLPAMFLFHDDLNGMDVFKAGSPGGFSKFGVVSTSQAGNPLQIIFLIIQEWVSPVSGSPGVGGGGGGYGGSGSVGSPAPVPTTVPTIPESPGSFTEQLSAGVSGAFPKETLTTVATTSETPVQSTTPANPAPVIPTVISYSVIRNAAILFGVVLVAALLVLRWQKGGKGT